MVNSESRRIARGQKSIGETESTGASEGIVENPVNDGMQRGTSGPHRNDGSRPDGETALSGGRCEDRSAINGEVKPPLGFNSYECPNWMGRALTSIPLMGYNKEYETHKTSAYKILRELRDFAYPEEIQRDARGLWYFLTKEVLQSGLRLDEFPKRICYFVWSIQTGRTIKGDEMSTMWLNKTIGDSPQGQEPIEQFRRELNYSLCVLSYQIALERGKEALEEKGEMHSLRRWCEEAWVLSETLAEDKEVWKSIFNEESWTERAYFEAAELARVSLMRKRLTTIPMPIIVCRYGNI